MYTTKQDSQVSYLTYTSITAFGNGMEVDMYSHVNL